MNIPTSVILRLFAGLMVLAVPPKSPGELKTASDLIVVGKIDTVDIALDEEGFQMIDRVYTVTIKEYRIEKGQTKAGEPVVATTWQEEYRPRGWTGHQGQNIAPEVGQTIRAYLRKLPEGAAGQKPDQPKLEFLLPNGLEVLEGPSTRPAD